MSAGELPSLATDPGVSAWVSANAGAGKTHVLTDRVTRLLYGAYPSLFYSSPTHVHLQMPHVVRAAESGAACRRRADEKLIASARTHRIRCLRGLAGFAQR